MASSRKRGHRHEVESEAPDSEEGVATGPQDAQLYANVSLEELAEEEIEEGGVPAPDRFHTPRLSGGDVDAGWDQERVRREKKGRGRA